MVGTVVNVNLQLFIPILIAVITAIVGPIWLSRHKESIEDRNKRLETTGELSVRIIDEGRDMRKELRDRVDSLEDRLAKATQAFQDALEQIRELKTENERCADLIEDLREELERYRNALSNRVDALEHPVVDNANKKDDVITKVDNGDSDGSIR